MMEIKQIRWMLSSRRDLKNFPAEARSLAGNQLWLVQLGRNPVDWKPLKSVGPGAAEIRTHKPHEHRVIYVAKFPEAIYVLHCFEKKTQQTSKTDIDKARAAYAEAANLLARAELMLKVRDIIEANGWSQRQAAKILGVGQPRIAEIMSFNTKYFSVDLLLKYLDKLGKRVDFVFRDKGDAA